MSELSEKARELRNTYQREWKRKHPEKARQYNQTYWMKKAAALNKKEENNNSSGSDTSPDPLLFNNDILKLYTWIEIGKLPDTHERVFPDRFLPKTDKQKKNWMECLDKLHRLDHCTLQEINGAIIFAREDPFWKDNFLSLLKLRDKDKDGVKYIDRFIAGYEKKYKSRKPKIN